uniref:peptidylprolyl isomerase n=1 Tax=Setaria italica TaxID=4555 RepID=K3ZTS8_SETIT
MRHAAVCHRDMVSFRSRFESRSGRRGLGGCGGGRSRRRWARAAGSTGRCDAARLTHWHVGPPRVSSATSACGWARSTSSRAPSPPQLERNGTDWLVDAVPVSRLPRTGGEPKTQAQTRRSAYPLPQDTTSCGAGGRSQRRSAPFGGGDGADALLQLRALLLQPHRSGMVALAPCGRVFASAKRKEKGVLCILGGEKKDVAEVRIQRRTAFSLLLASPVLSVAFSAYGKSKNMNPYDERRLLQQNKKIQEANRAPEDFPNFIREGFQVKVVTSDNYITRDSGLMYEDIKVGTGNSPKDGQQIIFHYVGYNEAGRRIDSTYIQGSPAKIRLGNGTLVPGKYSLAQYCFEEGIRDMKPGGKRRMIIPPELGPPVGPSTFFSAKQFEVFDVELLAVQDCQRRTIAFYSDVVCS